VASLRSCLALLALVVVASCTSAARSPHSTTPSVARSTSAPGSSPSVSSTPFPSATPSPTRTRHAVPAIPPVSALARADGLLDVRTVVPDAVIDLRYATPDNFTHVQLYPRDARCLIHRTMAAGLRTAARVLRREGYLLVFWDCYRPHAVQERMWQVVPNANWVARPGPYARSHESGRSVDVTLAHAGTTGWCTTQRVHGHCLLDMGTGFDDFTPRAYAYASVGISAAARANRALLREAMAAGGLSGYSGEWWHFDGPGAAVRRPILAAPLH
jgi:D-alanyl-D-alanine dipeptidase